MSRHVWPEPQQEALEFFSFFTCIYKQVPRQNGPLTSTVFPNAKGYGQIQLWLSIQPRNGHQSFIRDTYISITEQSP